MTTKELEQHTVTIRGLLRNLPMGPKAVPFWDYLIEP